MSWQQILPKIAVILPLALLLNAAFFESFYITSVIILFILIKIIARAELIFSTFMGILLILLIAAFLLTYPLLAFILSVGLHAMIAASILSKL